jgi:hypothetical protein
MGAIMTTGKKQDKEEAPPKPKQNPRRMNYVEMDETPAIITDHPFEPKGAWYTQCKRCNLAMAAHSKTTVNPRDHIGYFGDDDD